MEKEGWSPSANACWLLYWCSGFCVKLLTWNKHGEKVPTSHTACFFKVCFVKLFLAWQRGSFFLEMRSHSPLPYRVMSQPEVADLSQCGAGSSTAGRKILEVLQQTVVLVPAWFTAPASHQQLPGTALPTSATPLLISANWAAPQMVLFRLFVTRSFNPFYPVSAI